MALSALDDKATPPDEKLVDKVLGRSATAWRLLIRTLQEDVGAVTREWAFAGAAYGWSMRLVHQQRRLVYLTPCRGSFLAAVVLGEKAVRIAESSGLAAATIAALDAAPRYAEGRGVRLRVRTRSHVEQVRLLVRAKLAR
jgi:hypothetical protein